MLFNMFFFSGEHFGIAHDLQYHRKATTPTRTLPGPLTSENVLYFAKHLVTGR